jgi:hypothetical protein
VEFKPERQNTAADALSRRDEEGPAVHSLSIPTFKPGKQRLCLKSSTSVKLLKLVQRGRDGL